MSPDSAAAPTRLELQTHAVEDATVIQCIGRLTAEHSDALKTHVRGVIPHAKRIVLDLREIHRMDSSGLGAIVAVYISARKGNCEFLLVNYNKSVRDLLGLTNLLSVFEACAQTGTRIP
ncbi:MAG: STAS domain-containing protein [Candidatus Acidiferrales bacterium]|jgi:anti-anti-sigma factor